MLDFTFRHIHNNDWVTGILLLIIFLLVFAKMIHQDKFNKTLRLYISNRYFLNYGKESNRTFNAFSNVMHLVQLLSFSLLSYLIIEKWFKINESQLEFNFITILGLITLYFIGKLIIVKFIGYIFKINKLQNNLKIGRAHV